MPKRVIDGEGLWRSDKLAQVEPPSFRAEYACLLPLALANGVFEANPRRIWATVYSYNRPDVGVEQVEKILAEFERVKLLFRWMDAGKAWGYFVGIEKPGRLPAPSRLKHGHELLGPEPPKESLQIFIGSVVTDGQPMASHAVPNGSGGFGFCLGLGSGIGDGQPMASHEDQTHEPTTARTEGFNSTEVARAICGENGWSGLRMIEAFKTAMEFKSPEMPGSNLEQVGQWLVRAFSDHKAAKGDFAGNPLTFFQQAKYPHSGRKPAGTATLLPVNDPVAYALAQMEGD
jgi:hypothetical protein